MSIINEALKKAGREKNSPEGTASSDNRIPGTTIMLEKAGTSRGPGLGLLLFSILAVLVVALPVTAPRFASFWKGGTLASAPGQGSDRKAQFGVEEIMPFGTAASPLVRGPQLNLSGVAYSSPSDSYCIINNRIVRLGEEINGAKLVSVSPKEVVLDYKGQSVRLAVGD